MAETKINILQNDLNNQQNSYAEHIYSLNLDKQILAQALNNKGANVVATDSLAQMATKVDGLDVVGALEYIITPRIEINSAPPARKARTVRVPDTNLYVSVDNTAYDNYTIGVYKLTNSSLDLVSSIVLNTELTNNPTDAYSGFVFSKNKNIIGIQLGENNNTKGFIFNITDDGIITQIGKLTLPNYSTKMRLISNDGKKAFVTNSGYGYIYTITEEGQEVSPSTKLPSSMFSAYVTGWCDDDGSNAIFLNGGSTSSLSVVKGNINWDSNTVSLSSYTLPVGMEGTTLDYSGGIYPLVQQGLLVSVIPENNGNYGQLFVIDLNSMSVIKNLRIKIVKTHISDTPSYNYSMFYVSNIVDNIVTIYSYPFGIFKYNIVTNTLYDYDMNEITTNIVEYYYTDYYIDNTYTNAIGYGPVCNTVLIDNCIYSLSTLSSSDRLEGDYLPGDLGEIIGSVNNGYFKYVQDKKCFGIIYKRNGNSVLFYSPVVLQSDLSNGAYDVENSVVSVSI